LTKGGSGDDFISGGDGNDCIDGGSGEDIINGDDGNDTLEGGNHSDVLDGGLGDDHINGGWHTDTCIGGGGNDTFVSCEIVDDDPPGECGDATNDDACSSPTPAPVGCGNDICGIGEDCNSWSHDCAGKSNGKPSGRYCCGDGTIQSAESVSICDDNF
jgi:hypothetical protein